ncbi:hypothetical protein [Mucilaginibacter gracilis]|nr:hypothetical protein [Mucilaginibacter gracilis]
MKMLVEIADNKAASFKELIKQHSYVKAKTISEPNAAILEEIMHIKKAFKNLEKVKAGKLKTRPASELLNEL